MAEASDNSTISLAYQTPRRHNAALPSLSLYFSSWPVQLWRHFRHTCRELIVSSRSFWP